MNLACSEAQRARGRATGGWSSLRPAGPGRAIRTAACQGLSLLACIAQLAVAAEPAANVDGGRIAAADRDPANWMTYGRTYSEQRFSPLSKITTDNVTQLGLAWFANLETSRGQEATPLVIDGVMYVSTAWSMVKAFDAKDRGVALVLRPSRAARPWR